MPETSKGERIMSGIVGIASTDEVAPLLVESVTRLKSQDYDSCGVAIYNGTGIEVRKDVGAFNDVAKRWDMMSMHGQLGIAHTRKATHGDVSQENAHPHLSCDRSFAVVHSGIISNYIDLKTELQESGNHFFFSQTDTEVIAHLIEEAYQGGSVEEAFLKVLQRLEGTFAVAMISVSEPQEIFCASQKSPLVLGINSGTKFVSSNVEVFLPYTRRTVRLDYGEYAVVSSNDYCIRSISSAEQRYKEVVEIDWETESLDRNVRALHDR
jgi:glucosamine--fructose-6-phosphate aminotransferase (isomerizing)